MYHLCIYVYWGEFLFNQNMDQSLMKKLGKKDLLKTLDNKQMSPIC